MSGAENALGLDLGSGHKTTWGKEQNQWHVWPVRGQSQGAVNPAPVEKSGATVSYRTGDDGFHQAGVAWAGPRFTDNGDGTVTDNNTQLAWLKDAGVARAVSWADAVDFANALADGMAGLSDGSAPGDWRLPNARELFSLFDHGRQPLLPSGHPFLRASGDYWTSTTSPADPGRAY